MEKRWAEKTVHTFRLIQQEGLNPASGRTARLFVNAIIGVVSSIATVNTIDVALRSNILWAAFITLGIQTIAVSVFFFEPKYDKLTIRSLLASYLFFYVVAFFFSAGEPATPPLWVYSYIIFAFVGASNKYEAHIWTATQFLIVLGGMVYLRVTGSEVSGFEMRAFANTFALIWGFAFALDFASRLSTRRVARQTQQLEETNARYDVILNSVGDGLVATDGRGIVEFVNKKALELLRMSRADIIGQPLTAVLLAKDTNGKLIPHRERHITKVLAGGESFTLSQASKDRQYFIRGDGTDLMAGMTITPVRVVGEVLGAIMLFHDMSVEDQIDRAKSEFVSLASHQLRTPLNVVSWYIEKLLSQKKGPLNDRQQEYLAEVKVNNERMIRLVADLLNVSRVELGRVKLRLEKVDLAKLLRDLVAEIHPMMEKNNVVFTPQIQLSAPNMESSDLSVLTVVIQNLLSNAMKYTKAGGHVSLIVSESGSPSVVPEYAKAQIAKNPSGVYIAVKDSGIGIPKSQQDKIFSKLFRADNVQNLDVSGTGLGLYVTESFVSALGGAIWFESQENVGTTFCVYIPRSSGELTGAETPLANDVRK